MSIKQNTIFLLTGALCFLPLLEIFPEEPRAYTWYDGKKARKIWLQPGRIAEFGIRRGQPSRLGTRARGLKSSRFNSTRIWKLSKGSITRSLSRGRMPTGMAGHFSPVFTRGRAGRGPQLALPGGMIVYFEQSWTHSRIEKWAGARKLTILRKLNLIGNVYVIKSRPGLESLKVANNLRKLSGVKAAMPNIWRQVSPR